MKNTKKWFIETLIFIILGLGLVAGLVIVIDPFFAYHSPLENFPYQIDNQTSQNPGMAKNFEYDAILLGSSMTVNFESAWFDELYGEKLIKLCYNGAYPKDINNIVMQSDKSGNTVKRIYLGVDLKSYTGGVDETKYPIPEYMYTDNVLDDVNYWFNKDVILDYLVKPVIQKMPRTELSSVYNSEWWMKDYYSRNYVIENMERYPKNDAYFPDDMFLEGLNQNLEANIIPLIESHPDTEFVIFIPPYSVLYWYEYCQNNQFDAVVREYESFCEKILGLSEKYSIQLYFFAGDRDIVLNLDNYADVGHYRQSINRYMAECFGKDEHRLTLENRKAELSKWSEMVRNVDFDEIIGEN